MNKNFKLFPDERGLFSNSSSNDLNRNNLKGNVKSVVSLSKNIQSNVLSQLDSFNRQLFKVSDFNMRGEMIQYKEIYDRNDILLIKNYFYDQNDFLMKEEMLDEFNNVVETTSFSYNFLGLTVSEYREDFRELYTGFYDVNGFLERVVEICEYENNKETIFQINRVEKTPDIISEIVIYVNNRHLKSISFNYDSKDNPVEICIRDSKGELISLELIDYDENNNRIKSNKNSKVEYTFFYEYDKWNNWTSMMFYINDVFSSKETREIEYYK